MQHEGFIPSIFSVVPVYLSDATNDLYHSYNINNIVENVNRSLYGKNVNAVKFGEKFRLL